MRNASGFICAILLAVTTSTALPSDRPIKKVAKKPAANRKAAPAATMDSVQHKVVSPVFHWFGPLEQKKGQKDKC